MSNARIFTLPCGRMVQGHPMDGRTIVDKVTKQPALKADGTPKQSWYIAVAVAKMGEQDWRQTEWGAQIQQAGMEGWPNGEHGSPQFAWKVVDGDSPVPDQNGQPWNQKEGFPGHWVIKCSTHLAPVPCYHVGRYQPHEVIQNAKEVKCGDYVRVQIEVVGNAPSLTPGVYINPKQLELSRAGQQIVTASMPDANEAFGGSQAQIPQNATLDNSVQNNNMGNQGGYQNNANPNQNYQQQNNQNVQQNNYQQNNNANMGNPNQNYQQNGDPNQANNNGGYQNNNMGNQGGYQQNNANPNQNANNGNPAQGYNQAPQNFMNN